VGLDQISPSAWYTVSASRCVRGLRTATDGVSDVQHVVPVLQRLNGSEREADLRVQPADDQPPSSCCLLGLPKGFVLERFIDDRSIGSTPSSSARTDGSVGPFETELHAHRRKDDRHAIRLGGLGQQPDMQLDQVGGRLSDRMTSNISFW